MGSSDRAERAAPSSTAVAVGAAITLTLHAALAVGVLAVVTWVVPRFEEMFAEVRVELPALTRLLIMLSDLWKQFWYLAVPVLALLLCIDALIFWLLVSRRGTWVLGALWSVGVVAVVGVGGVGFVVIALFLPLVGLMQNIGHGG